MTDVEILEKEDVGGTEIRMFFKMGQIWQKRKLKIATAVGIETRIRQINKINANQREA